MISYRLVEDGTQQPFIPEFLTVEEVAAIMRVSKMTVYRLVHCGDLESVQFGKRGNIRVKYSAFEEWISTHPAPTVDD